MPQGEIVDAADTGSVVWKVNEIKVFSEDESGWTTVRRGKNRNSGSSKENRTENGEVNNSETTSTKTSVSRTSLAAPSAQGEHFVKRPYTTEKNRGASQTQRSVVVGTGRKENGPKAAPRPPRRSFVHVGRCDVQETEENLKNYLEVEGFTEPGAFKIHNGSRYFSTFVISILKDQEDMALNSSLWSNGIEVRKWEGPFARPKRPRSQSRTGNNAATGNHHQASESSRKNVNDHQASEDSRNDVLVENTDSPPATGED